jgi:hypothetical protein
MNNIGVTKKQSQTAKVNINSVGKNLDEIMTAITAAGLTKEETQTVLLKVLNHNATVEEAIAEVRPVEVVETVEEPATVAANRATAAKSKVCVIANSLKGMNRSEAFRKAWAIVKAATVETKVAGVTAGRRQEALEKLTRYDTDRINVILEREVANEYDNNAVAVKAAVTGKGSYTVGYLPRTLAAMVAPLIDAGKAVTATFKEVRGKYQSYHNYGLAVSVQI